jgi:hypothetical protein
LEKPNYYIETGDKGQKTASLLSLRSRRERVAFSLKVGQVIFGCPHLLYPAVFQSDVRQQLENLLILTR